MLAATLRASLRVERDKKATVRTARISIAYFILFGWGPRMAVDGHGHAMTIADYIAIGVLIVLAIWAGARLYLRGKL